MAGFQAQNGSLSQDEEESKSTPAPKFTRQEIFRMKDQMGEHITDIYITETGTTELENLSHNIIDVFIIET